jgi:hypothetical protein
MMTYMLEVPAGRPYAPDEFIEPVAMPNSEALEKVRTGEITDGKTICTLLYAAGFVLGR